MSRNSVPARITTAGDLAVIDSERFDLMEKVAEYKMHGETDHAISKRLNIPRKEVKELFNDYKDVIQQDVSSRDVAKDFLNQMIAHFDEIIKKSYQLYDDLNNEPFSHQISAQINAVLKNISSYEAERLKFLQSAGLLDAADLGDELAEREEKEAILLDILRNHLCVDCKQEVARRLSAVSGNVEGVVVD